MSNGYVIRQVIYNRAQENGIPYFAAALVQGPRGGYMVLDEFSFEVMIRNSQMTYEEKEFYVRHKGKTVPAVDKRFVQFREYKVDTLVNKVATVYRIGSNKKFEVVKRNREKAEEIGRNLDTRTMQKINE